LVYKSELFLEKVFVYRHCI